MDLILSDIHSNLQALKAALRHVRRRTYERIVLLGDLVGYGANPNETLGLLRGLAPQVAVRGNHDRGCAFPGTDLGFSLPARSALAWTRAHLEPDHACYLAALASGPQVVGDGDYLIAHGSPLDEDAYLLQPRDVLQAFEGFAQDLCFFGHTHLPGAYELDESAQRLSAVDLVPGEWFRLREGCRYLVNPGSVGQPRDRDPRLAFMTYDPHRRRLKLHRLDYDHEGAARAIREAGLPPHLAERLHHGM